MKASNEYKTSIIQFLNRSRQPVDVEKIRVTCNIGNWQTALKHCLELLHDREIRGTKTSKSWIFWSKTSKADIVPREER